MERGTTAIVKLAFYALERMAGRVRAWFHGWERGFIAQAPRIIGSSSVHVGKFVAVGRGCWIEAISSYGDLKYSPRIEIGDRFCASPSLHISCIDSIRIGKDCLLGSSVHISDHGHGAYIGETQTSPLIPPIARPLFSKGPVEIGDRVWIGDNVLVLGPAQIGAGVVIGANSIVSGVIPENTMIAGCPAKVLKTWRVESAIWEVTRSST